MLPEEGLRAAIKIPHLPRSTGEDPSETRVPSVLPLGVKFPSEDWICKVKCWGKQPGIFLFPARLWKCLVVDFKRGDGASLLSVLLAGLLSDWQGASGNGN